MSEPLILVVTGPPGAGKSTVARELADRFEPSVHLETDLLFASIRRGFVQPWKVEAAGQNRTVVTAAARVAATYALAGYATFVDGVVLPWALDIYRAELAQEGMDVRCAVLLPDVEEVVRRGMARGEDHGLDENVYRDMHRKFVEAFEGAAAPVFRGPSSALDTVSSILTAHVLG